MRTNGLFTAILSILVAACAPSETIVQTAMAETQRAWTPTPQATATTPSCTDKGWGDIAVYLQVGLDVRSLETLKNMKAKISEVEIDACTEEARQLLLTAFAGEIESLTILNNSECETGIDSSLVRFRAQRLAMERTAAAIQRADILLSQVGLRLRYP